jgi:hypothetical protein
MAGSPIMVVGRGDASPLNSANTLNSAVSDRNSISGCLESMDQEFQSVMAEAAEALRAFKSWGNISPELITAAGCPLTTDMLLADNQEAHLQGFLGVWLVCSLRRAVEEVRGGPEQQAENIELMHVMLQEVKARGAALQSTISRLCEDSDDEVYDEDSDDRIETPALRWARNGYEPHFGKAELAILRQSGSEGQAILSLPISDTAICSAEMWIERNWSSSTGLSVTPVSPYLTSQAVLDEFESTLKAMEAEIAESKKAGKGMIPRWLQKLSLRIVVPGAKRMRPWEQSQAYPPCR